MIFSTKKNIHYTLVVIIWEKNNFLVEANFNVDILEDSWNYMLPILVSSTAKCIATQVLVISKLNRRKDFILRDFVCDIKHPINELFVQN